MFLFLILDVVIAYMLDLLLGDPYWLPHPVRFIGWLVRKTEKVLRRIIDSINDSESGKASREKLAGIVLAVLVVTITSGAVYCITEAALLINPFLFHAVNIYFIYSSLAARCLADEAGKVYRVLKSGDLAGARKQLSMLVGRQTENLNEAEIIRGVVETTAENTVDGVISPMLYALLGSIAGIGAPLAYAFKAVSTLDSMVGYMNDRYLYFGRASARIDDAANYIPARLSGIILPLSSLLCGMGFLRSFSIMCRDRRNHKSPNCGFPEAAVAGALDVRLGGTNVYFGEAVFKPTIGDAGRELRIGDIHATIRIMYVASLLTLVSGIGFVLLIGFFPRLLF